MDPASLTGTLALDAMGGDLGPAEVVAAVAQVLREEPSWSGIILVGQENVLAPELARHQLAGDPRVQVFHASQVINMDEKPLVALKRGKDSSMVRAIELVKENRARAVISCGNTGSLMAAGTIRLRPLEGIERPSLACVMPRQDGHFILCDAGANPSSQPIHLVHNAILASHYAEIVLKTPQPRVGLLTIGTEEGKGNERTQETHAHLKQLGGLISYQGLIEGFQVFEGQVDVVICDGFTGNVLLKTCEGLVHFLRTNLASSLRRDPLRMAGAFLARGAFRELKALVNPDRYAGARLLGLRGHIFKSHGSSNRQAIASAIRIAMDIARHDMTDIIREEIARANSFHYSPRSTLPPATPHSA